MMRIDTDTIQPYENLHLKKLRKLAPECMVLLKKDGAFPVSPCSIAAYGSGVRHTIKGGTGSGDVNVRSFLNIEKALEQAGFTIVNTGWLDAYDGLRQAHENARKASVQTGEDTVLFETALTEPDYDLPVEDSADTAVYVLTRICGEGADRKDIPGDYQLTDTEIRDIHRIADSHRRFMLVLNTGAPIDLSPVVDVPNILLLGQLGSVTAEAFTDVLTGKENPSGRLTATWAVLSDYASTEGFGDPNDTVYHDGIYVGYRWFDTFGKTPLFSFGYGLSYTEFEAEVKDWKAEKTDVCIQVAVKNTGKYPGSDVIQIFASRRGEGLDCPVKELIAFMRTDDLQPGEQEELWIRFPVTVLAAFDTKSGQEMLFAGRYCILLGDGTDSFLTVGDLVLEQDRVLRKLSPLGGLSEEACLHAPAVRPKWPKNGRELVADTMQIKAFDEPVHQKQESSSCETVLAGLSDDQLARLCLGDFKEGATLLEIIGNASTIVAGAAGQTSSLWSDQGIRPLIMADGPAGLRLSKRYVLNGEEAVALDASLTLENQSFSGEQSVTEGKVYYQYCTAIPVGTAIAQSWDIHLAQTCGEIVGEEMEQFGIDIWLAPALNIQRNPLCGRNFEYYSEDPLLSGEMAAAVVAGVEQTPGRMTTIKHLACNNQETSRYFSNSLVSERAMRSIYLKGFEHCIRKSHPSALMTSYNLLNGEHTCNRRDLLTDVLHNEWQFDGLVMTDWLVTGGAGTQGEKHPCASAAGCIKAGNHLVMPGMASDLEDILSAIENPDHKYPLTRQELLNCAGKVLETVRKSLRTDKRNGKE
ncbi:MAG: glycoside hydrolase family 3 C-terminal domain-containing protein [Blautia sp.]|nr:glycoside hydrolase family 3 C-terminal domain-containing protein [Blautia sp.]